MNASNTPRSLDAIGADLRKLRNIFDSGKLLVEAREACEHGEWLDWLDTYFDASEDTAERHMAAYRLSLKFRTVRNLALPPTIVYELGEDIDADLPAIIAALDKASKSGNKPLGVDAANEVINLVRLRIEFGDYPPATLRALRGTPHDGTRSWGSAAVEALKKARPTTNEEAERIVLDHHRRYVETFYGGLPAWLDETALDFLDQMKTRLNEQHREQVTQKLQAAATPLDLSQVMGVARDVQGEPYDVAVSVSDEDQSDDADDDEPTQNGGKAPTPSPPDGLAPELIEALRVIVHFARRPMPTSIGGINGAELVEAARFLDKLHELATGGSTVKRIADAAEARSRSGRAANGEGLTERWSES
jgi:hypothetical protein